MCSQRGGGYNIFPGLKDVLPICVPCDGIGYRAPFRKEAPFKLTFLVVWYLEKLEQEKKFLLTYLHFDGTIELKDLDRQRTFLKRMRLDNVKLGDLFVGNKLLILARHMTILEYGDGFTKDYCESKCQRAFLMVRPEAMENLPCIIQRLEKCFKIIRAKISTLPQHMAYEFNKHLQHKDSYIQAVSALENKNVAAFLVISENALEKMKNLVGEDEDPKVALLKYHQSLRALFGQDSLRNGFLYSETPECVVRQASYFFSEHPSCNLLNYSILDHRSTCCIIKPHIMREGRAGIVLTEIIGNGFQLTGLGVFWLNRRQAEEFYEIYKRIYAEAEFTAMVNELSVGPCMVVELRSAFENSAQTLRNVCGPLDSDLARKVRSRSIRARHGINKIQNAVHCTELPEDTLSELEYFFQILDRQPNGIKSVTRSGVPVVEG